MLASSHEIGFETYFSWKLFVTFSFVVAFLYQQNLNHTICQGTTLNRLGCFRSKKNFTWQSCSWTFLYYNKDHHIIQTFDRNDLAQQQRVSWNFIYMTLYLYYYIYLWMKVQNGFGEKQNKQLTPGLTGQNSNFALIE